MKTIVHAHCRAFALSMLLALAAGWMPLTATATEPAQDENLAYAIGVQTYISGFPVMDLYRTLWETSFNPDRGHDFDIIRYYSPRAPLLTGDWMPPALIAR